MTDNKEKNNSTERPVTIRHAVTGDEQKIIREWETVYKSSRAYKYPARWKWQFIDNPFLPKNYGDNLPIWIALQDNQVVGWSCAMLTQGMILKHQIPIALGVDMHVKSSQRGKRLGYRLQKENQNNHQVFVSMQMSQGSRHIKLKIGGQPGPPLRIYLKLIKQFDPETLYNSMINRIRHRIKRKLFVAVHRGLLGLDFLVLSQLLSFLFKKRQNANCDENFSANENLYQFDRVVQFGDEADSLWSKVQNEYGFAVNRDQTYLNWKYVQQPQLKYEKYYLRENGYIVGLIVFRVGEKPELRTGVITELLAIDDSMEKYRTMLKFAEKKLKESGALSIRCAASLKHQETALNNNGFQLIEIKTPVIHVDQSRLPVGYKQLNDLPWLMSLGDQDMDIPLLNQQPGLGDLLKIARNKMPAI